MIEKEEPLWVLPEIEQARTKLVKNLTAVMTRHIENSLLHCGHATGGGCGRRSRF